MSHNLTWSGHNWETNRAVPFLRKTVQVEILTDNEQTPPTDRQLELLAGLEKLPPSLLTSLDDAAEVFRKEIDDAITLEDYDLGHINRANIRDHYRVDSIIIPRLGSSRNRYYFILAECDWEPEHGMEILMCNEKIIATGPQNCLFLNEAWDKYISEGT